MLQISRVQKEDSGKYTCQAVNEAGADRMTFDLEVLGRNSKTFASIDIFLHLVYACIQSETIILTSSFFVFLTSSPRDHRGSGLLHGGGGGGGEHHGVSAL